MNLLPSQLPDITDFTYQECTIAGDECVWFFPHLEGVKWTPQNLIFRSSIWRKSDWTLISASFKKFFNWMQEPDLYPPPDAMSTKLQCMEKLDGSCLIVSKYKGELIIRTRRSMAQNMLNGHEIELFKQRYPKVFNHPLLSGNDEAGTSYSFIFEWLTPTNQIVVKYDEPEIRLTGVINHDNYNYVAQHQLDVIAAEIGVARPKYFNYSTIEEMLANVAEWKGAEGLCVYYGNGQHIRKIKGDWYLSVHNFRNAMNLKNIVDLYFIMEQPDYQTFCDGVQNQFDWEGLMMAKPLISQVCDGMKTVHNIIDGMNRFIQRMTKGEYADANKMKANRKAWATEIIASYGETSRADIAFTLLDGKPLNRNQWKKLLFQSLLS